MCDTAAFDGFALSPGVLNRLAAKGTVVHQCRWRYGDAYRKHPFPPHRALAGKFTGPNGRALGYFPGDHKGCLCSLVPVLCQLPTRGPITAAMEANPCAPPEQTQRVRPPMPELLTDAQWAALDPTLRGHQVVYANAKAALEATPDGKILFRTLEQWIRGDRALGAIRKTIDGMLKGIPGTGESGRKAFNLLRALKESPYAAPDSLYRGMFIRGADAERIIAKHFASETIDINIASFSANRSRAAAFANVGKQKWSYRRVVMEWRGPKQSMPVRNAASSSKAYDDVEWIGAGRFRVVSTKVIKDEIRVVVEQVNGI